MGVAKFGFCTFNITKYIISGFQIITKPFTGQKNSYIIYEIHRARILYNVRNKVFLYFPYNKKFKEPKQSSNGKYIDDIVTDLELCLFALATLIPRATNSVCSLK